MCVCLCLCLSVYVYSHGQQNRDIGSRCALSVSLMMVSYVLSGMHVVER